MAKGHGKSSATSATRKKNLQKTAAALGIELDATKPSTSKGPKNKDKSGSGRGKKDKKEPRQKVYIPPVKPARVVPDPLDVGGLARRLPPELVVVLRNVGKKAGVTKGRALEELSTAWVERAEEDAAVVESLVDMVPAWIHYVPPLFVHPSRRIRLLSVTVHAGLLGIPEVKRQILFQLKEVASQEDVESILGSWCVLCWDGERSVGGVARQSWNTFIKITQSKTEETTQHYLTLDNSSKSAIFSFVQRTILDPNGIYTYLNPPAPTVPPSGTSTPPSTNKGQRPGTRGMSKQQQLAAAIAAAKRSGEIDGEPARAKAEEFEESETDRKARLRIGGVGALRWFLDVDNSGVINDLVSLLKNPMLWTVLYHGEKPPFVDQNQGEGFGFGQPNVRKTGWELLMKLLASPKEQEGVKIGELLPILSSAVLRSAWVETDVLVQGVMWQPLLKFIKEYPECWDLEMKSSDDDGEQDAKEEGTDEETSEDEEKDIKHKPNTIHKPVSSLAYQDFLQFLQLGCSGSPVQGYPTVMIILSTIPSSVIASPGSRKPLEDLFTSFWAALDGRALSSLHRAVTSAAFLSALLECILFMLRRVISDGVKMKQSDSARINSLLVPEATSAQEVFEETGKLVGTQFSKVWEEVKSRRLKVEERAAARLVGKNLEALVKVDQSLGSELGLFESAWSVLKAGLQDAVKENAELVSVFLKVLSGHFKEGQKGKTEVTEVMGEILEGAVSKLDLVLEQKVDVVTKEDTQVLECILAQFREGLFEDEVFAKKFDSVIIQHAGLLLDTTPTLILSYLTHRKTQEKVLELWHALLSTITSASNDLDTVKKVANSIVHAVQNGGLPTYLRPKGNELDAIVGSLVESVVQGAATKDEVEIVKAVLSAHQYFITESGYTNAVDIISHGFCSNVDLALGLVPSDEGVVDLNIFETPLELLELMDLDQEGNIGLGEEIFIFGYLVPECKGIDDSASVFVVARRIWAKILARVVDNEEKKKLVESVKINLKDLLINTQVKPLPADIIRALSTLDPKMGISILQDVFPSQETLNGMLQRLPQDPIDPSIGVIDPLIPLDLELSDQAPEGTDSKGFSSYARIINALLQVLSEDRKLAKKNLWALRHFIALSIFAGDYQKVPAGVSPLFDAKALATGLVEVIAKGQQVIAYLFSGALANVTQNDWRKVFAKNVSVGKYGTWKNDGLEAFVEEVLRCAIESDGLLEARILKVVLDNVLDELDVEEAEEWVGLARKLEKSAPQTSMSIIAAITETGAEPMRLDRYRNEQAAGLLGVKPSMINSEGLSALRKLAAAAPDMESDVVFLPQNRAVNMVRACQGWVTADDSEVEEEVESVMTLIFGYLAPILQNVPGGHWEFIWDVLENNLENSSMTDDSTLVVLARSLKLVIIIEDLVKANKTLRAEWQGRRMGVLKAIKSLALVKLDTVSPSLPRSICRELVLNILRDLPESLIDENTLPQMCHLVTDHSIDVQKMAYKILSLAAKKRTEYLVIEASVNTESNFKAELPLELLEIIQRHVNMTNLDDEDEQQTVFGSLLGWSLLFDLFQDASLRVRSSYIEQIRNLDFIARGFMPTFLTLLDLEGGPTKAFKLDVWSVQEFFVDLFEIGNSISIPLFTAHLYYRALLSVPSLVHSWLLDCKDRQLSTTVTTYTSQHFSPVIIDVELAHVKGPAGQELSDENLSVKVASVVNEVTASYLVDEHQLEIKFKIPTDWPLHKIEVKDMKRVGVDENRWRAWILAVQQTIWSHNGRIIDGLSLFKKNVTLHFEGQVECAICYSIISVMDGSLPKKPCKTCKNKFHAGCLYKWFNTSHNSTCPLCRSDIF